MPRSHCRFRFAISGDAEPESREPVSATAWPTPAERTAAVTAPITASWTVRRMGNLRGIDFRRDLVTTRAPVFQSPAKLVALGPLREDPNLVGTPTDVDRTHPFATFRASESPTLLGHSGFAMIGARDP